MQRMPQKIRQSKKFTMKKTSFRITFTASLLILISFLLSACGKTAEPAADPFTDIAVLSTTDMHGKCWETSILTGQEETRNMLRVSSAVSAIRNEYGADNVLLIDNGDAFEGTPEAELTLRGKEDGMDPGMTPAMAVCLGDIGYDAFVLGNHEFNYSWNRMEEVYGYLNERGTSVLAANIYYDGSDGIHAAGENVFKPYIIRTVEVNGHEHRIGIIGLENTDISRWDKPENYPGMVFAHPDNTAFSAAWEVSRYVPQLKENGCEFIIVSIHCAIGSDERELTFGVNTEDQALRMIEESEMVDMVICGHDHFNSYSNTYYKDRTGKEVLLVNGGGQNLTKTVIRLSEDASGALAYEIQNSENLTLADYEPDEALMEKMRPYAEQADRNTSQPIGTISDSFDSSPLVTTRQTGSGDLIHAAMMKAGDALLAEKYQNSEEAFHKDWPEIKHMTTDLCISTVPVRDDYAVTPGVITLKDVHRLFIYPNPMIVFPIKGSVLKEVMEENCEERIRTRVLNGKPYFYSTGDYFTCLTFGGINFTADFSREAGSRVAITGFSNGREFSEDDTYLAAVNTYLFANSNTGLRVYEKDDFIAGGELLIQDAIARYIEDSCKDGADITGREFNWKWNYEYTDAKETSGSETAYASLEEQPEDGGTYLIYDEADEMVLTYDARENRFGYAKVKAKGNDLIEPLPDNALRLRVQYQEGTDAVYLLDSKGRYLAPSYELAWLDAPGEDSACWKLVSCEGAWFMLNRKAYDEGRKLALRMYRKDSARVYNLEYRGFFFQNFYREN